IDAASSVPRGSSPEISVAVGGRADDPAPTGTVTVTAGFRIVGTVPLDEDGTVEVQLPPVRTTTLVTAVYSGDHGYLPGLDVTTVRARGPSAPQDVRGPAPRGAGPRARGRLPRRSARPLRSSGAPPLAPSDHRSPLMRGER